MKKHIEEELKGESSSHAFNVISPIKKNQKSHKSINGIPINVSNLRADVVLKGILRLMRKYYLDEFN